ncbi:MAG: SH3 domain-containing protein, partial [Candidatus Latescibacterota bacterium]
MNQRSRFMLSIVWFLAAFPLAASAQLANRAPDVYPGTLPAMRTPEYWINRMPKPDEVLLPPAEIARRNATFQMFLKRPDPFQGIPADRRPALMSWWPGFLPFPPDMQAMTPEARSDSVQSLISAQIKYLRVGSFANVTGVRYSARDLDRFEREMARDIVPREITIRQGMIVHPSRLRVIPSFLPQEQGICDSSLSVSGKTIRITVHWDTWNNGVLKIGSPVHVLHTSRTGEFFFVTSGPRYGWTRAKNLAFASEREIREFSEPADFVVCTGNRVPLYADPSCRAASGWFMLGDRLPLADKSNPRKVKIPVRRGDGALFAGTAWLAEDAAVHAGWLPYTRRNVVRTAFKLLDSPYDWSGGWFGRDHITIYRDIFSVFGFDLPWHDGLFTFYGQNRDRVEPGIGRDRQFREVLSHEPFITVMSCNGHAKLFFGDHNGAPVVFAHYGHGYVDE